VAERLNLAKLLPHKWVTLRLESQGNPPVSRPHLAKSLPHRQVTLRLELQGNPGVRVTG